MSTDVGAKKRAGIVVVLGGLALLIIALVPGTGVFPGTGIGAGRITAFILAAIAVAFGIALTRKQGHTAPPPE